MFSLPGLVWSARDHEQILDGARAVARAALLSQIFDRGMGKIACAAMSNVWRVRAADVLTAVRRAGSFDETVAVLNEDEGGGVAMEWTQGDRTLSIVLPVEGRHVFYSARAGAMERTGFARPGAETAFARWLSIGGELAADGVNL
jgi:hypothetical protein